MITRLFTRLILSSFCTLIVTLFALSSHVEAEGSHDVKQQLDAYHALKGLLIESLNQSRVDNAETLKKIISENDSAYDKICKDNESTYEDICRDNDSTYNDVCEDNERTFMWIGIIVAALGVALGCLLPLYLNNQAYDRAQNQFDKMDKKLTDSEKHIQNKYNDLYDEMNKSQAEMQKQLNEYKDMLDKYERILAGMKEQKLAVDTKASAVKLSELKSKLYAEQNPQKRIDEISILLEDHDQDDELWTMRGAAYRELRQYAAAQADFKTAYSMNHHNKLALDQMAENALSLNLPKKKAKKRPANAPHDDGQHIS